MTAESQEWSAEVPDRYEFCNCLHTRRNHTSNGIGHCMFYDGMPCPCSEFRFPNFRESSSLVPQGAESAEIGKLDTADKSVSSYDDVPDQTVPVGCVRAREHLRGEAHDCKAVGKVNRVEEKESVIRDSRIANDPTSQSEGETAFYERLDDMIAKNGGTMPEREDDHE